MQKAAAADVHLRGTQQTTERGRQFFGSHTFLTFRSFLAASSSLSLLLLLPLDDDDDDDDDESLLLEELESLLELSDDELQQPKHLLQPIHRHALSTLNAVQAQSRSG